MTGTSTYVAPPSSEYWNLATATSSVADRFSVAGLVRRQLLLPFGAAENAPAGSTGAVVSWAEADGTAIKAATIVVATAIVRSTLSPLMDPTEFDRPAN